MIFANKIYIFLLISSFALSAKTQFEINPSIRYSCPRNGSDAVIVYYFSKPSNFPKNYPIVMLCEGSSSKGNLESVFKMNNYLGKSIDALNCGLITVEKFGIDGDEIDEKSFWQRYTRSQRFSDHMDVIKHLEANPPEGWNKFLVFLGGSEGGPLVNQLSIAYSKTLATINWAGAGNWDWADEFWEFFEQLKRNNFWMWLYDLWPRWLPFANDIPKTRQEYDKLVDNIKQNPTSDMWLGGMTYLYHADAFNQKQIDYAKIYAPMLVVMGTRDSLIASCDEFVKKAEVAGAPITYFRVDGMDHCIRRRPDIIEKSFEWLRQQLKMLK